MTDFPDSALTVRGGFVLLDTRTGQPRARGGVIPFQFNPDTLTRTVQPQAADAEPGDRLEVLRLAGPARETLKFDAEFDATEQLDRPDDNPNEAHHGLFPALSALEMSIYPEFEQLFNENSLAVQGILEVAQVEAPLSILVLGRNRVLPVRITDFSITEEAYDSSLNPIRAKVSIGVRVLTVDDVGFDHPAGILYQRYHLKKQAFAAMVNHSSTDLGVGDILGDS